VDVIEREIIERFRGLTLEQRRQVRDFVARLAAGHGPAMDLRDHALREWLSPEEDAAWAHLQDGSVSEDVCESTLPPRKAGMDLRGIVGTISPEDLDRMEVVIEEDCERIDLEGW
jgi:hypothetical protein